MRIDAHIHTGLDPKDYRDEYLKNPEGNRARLIEGLRGAGLDGGVIISVDPLTFRDWDPEQRLEDVLRTCGSNNNLYPFYWINPLESDALDQIDLAVEKGINGFKIICSEFAPSNEKCLLACEKIAKMGKPVLFHSGILWDGMPSANFNKPSNFEALIEIPKLRFCLAHVSWPWCDECIAVYGKFNNAYYTRPDMSCEMFIDVTPGTPRGYRDEVFTRLLDWSTYELRYNLIFGTDCNTVNYNTSWAKEWQQRDDAIYRRLITENTEDFLEHVYYKNIMRFMGLSDEKPAKSIPMVGE
ncbi:MAG: amidohydrolase family protein [Eubacteriales bacterium]|nr:amidohydrolase family protein [Eubacteriales bacterium]